MPVPPVIQMYRYVMGSGGGLGNLLKASEEFQQTDDWVRYPTNSQTPTVNADSRPDPNGGTTADQVGLTANTSARLQQTVTLSASTEYTFSVYARAVSGTVDFRMRNVTLKAAEVKTATTTGGDGGGFTRFTYTFTTTTAGPYELALQNDTNATAKDVIFWGAMLNQGGTALDYEYAAPTTGGSAPAPAYAGFGDAFGGVTAYYSLRQFTEAETLNAIRVRRSSDDTEQDIGFDSNGDLDTTTLLDFVGGQNLFVQSNQFDTTWSKTADVTGGQSGYDGSSDAWLLEANSVNQYERVAQSVTTTGLNTCSIYAKADTADFLLIYNNNFSRRVWFNLSTGSVGSSSLIVSATMEDVGSGWYRCSVVMNLSSSSSQYWICVANTDNDVNATTGDSIYIQHAQLEEGSTATTYKPTTTGIGGNGAVTTFYDQSGNGNNATNSTESEQPLVVSGGTLVEENGKAAIEFDVDWLTTTYPLPSVFSTFNVVKSNLANTFETIIGSETTFDDWIWHLFRSDKFQLRPDSGSYYAGATLSAQQYLINSIYNGDLNAYIDGNSYISQSSVALPAPSGNLQIGTAQSNASYSLNGRLQEIIFFDSDQSSNRTGIETNINDHFSIYT